MRSYKLHIWPIDSIVYCSSSLYSYWPAGFIYLQKPIFHSQLMPVLDSNCITVPQKWWLLPSMSREHFKRSFSGVIKSSSFSVLDQQGCPAEFKWPERKSEKRLSLCVCACVLTHMGCSQRLESMPWESLLCANPSHIATYRMNHWSSFYLLSFYQVYCCNIITWQSLQNKQCLDGYRSQQAAIITQNIP